MPRVRKQENLITVTKGVGDNAGEDQAGRRLKGLGLHLAIYFGVMVLAVPLNLYLLPENPLFLLPMIGWGAVLALHVAYVMGLFRGLFGPSG